ncbi:MAG TPA: tyrosine-type recombinase/integrase [Candidatus Pelethocola excrementipullorum]|nr:tyrosine-type recombinase/integrase [Candidatus Pelethocola excrementipullorum]
MVNYGIEDKQIVTYIQKLRYSEKSEHTLEKYRRDITRFSKFIGERQITKELVLEYKDSIRKDYEPVSVNSMLAAVNGFLKDLGYSNCCVKNIKIQRRIFCDENQEITKSEYLRLLATAKSRGKERLNLILQTICSTGIRVSELEYITVEAVQRGKAEVSCKGKIRVIFLSKNLSKILLKYVKSLGIKDGSVFVTKGGLPVNRSNIWREMKCLCREAKVDSSKVFPHNLRHLFARTYYKLKKDVVRLAGILGHSSIETTRIYLLDSGKECLAHVSQMGLVSMELSV